MRRTCDGCARGRIRARRKRQRSQEGGRSRRGGGARARAAKPVVMGGGVRSQVLWELGFVICRVRWRGCFRDGRFRLAGCALRRRRSLGGHWRINIHAIGIGDGGV